jgi:RNA polymerase sigma-70 factor (ECF subfamily)
LALSPPGDERRPRAEPPAGEPSDDALMARLAAGDAEALRLLSRRYLARIVALASRTLADPAEAEDVAQEAFLRLWRFAPRWRPDEARVGTWLHRVALNLCLDRRARKREELGEPPAAVDPAPGPARALQQREMADHVRAALDRLPDAQRNAIALCHYQGMRNIEAAEVMGVSVEALESLLARGRRKLREELRTIAHELLEEG